MHHSGWKGEKGEVKNRKEEARARLGFSRLGWCPLPGLIGSVQISPGNADPLNLGLVTWAAVSPVEIALSARSHRG